LGGSDLEKNEDAIEYNDDEEQMGVYALSK